MTTIDWAILITVLISTLFSIKRGFVKEALSLLTWIVALIVGRLFSTPLASLLVDYIETPGLRLTSAFVMLFVATLVVGAMVNHLLGELIRLTGLSGTDRLFGMVFGLARGLIVVVVAVAIIRLTPLAEDYWWQESRLIPELLELEQKTREVFANEYEFSLNQVTAGERIICAA